MNSHKFIRRILREETKLPSYIRRRYSEEDIDELISNVKSSIPKYGDDKNIDDVIYDEVREFMMDKSDFGYHGTLRNDLIGNEYFVQLSKFEEPLRDYVRSIILDTNLQESIRKVLKEELYSPGGTEMTPNKFVTHQSNPVWRKNIQLTGLQTSVGECYENHAMGLYGEWYTECQPAIFATDSLNKEDMFDSTYDDDTWVINTECAGVTWYRDAHFEGGDYSHHIVTFENISPDCLKLIHKGTGKSW
jgi:hypothetical protein